MSETRAQAVLSYWFGEPRQDAAYFRERMALWFGADAKTDERIRRDFTTDVEAAEAGALAAWESQPESCLALILLLDQFSMNMERDTRRCYERSALALPVALRAIERGFDLKVDPVMRSFFYMPLEHSEDLAHQQQTIELFRKLVTEVPATQREVAEGALDFAMQHFVVIEKYGRFPGRNEVFGRVSSPAEQKYLDDGGWF